MEGVVVPSARIVGLEEVHPAMQNQSVRVFGRLVEFDPSSQIAVLNHQGHSLRVNTELIAGVVLKSDSQYQFIGELRGAEDTDGSLVLEARVCRLVDGIDLELFQQALQLRNQFLQG
eukprot:gnl/Spiro4/2753_TR1339_c0_g1_i1.p1 gnl/Spiro4/2753_TR1339_c0_g1~~gnl/Spiro4/2753_TR1339_c0_g1_i1.p1  ORF type:complete len:126 (+),score=20.76 gnl/Spiro4/2753_TR1339_c0_g1_i1:30-380(+)